MIGIRVELPWPPKELWVNTHVHWSKKTRCQKQAKVDGQMATLKALDGPLRECYPTDGPIMVKLTFCPPDKRRRDRDGMQSAMKHYLDGIALALNIDDSLFAPYSVVGEVDPRRGTVWAEIGK